MSDETIKDSNFDTGAVRSADVDGYDFCSAPLVGLLGMLRVSGGGGVKYGRYNYMLGMPIHDLLNHVALHLIRYVLGDRSEDHLSKVAWGALVANQTAVLNPEQAAPHMLGPGATLTPAVLAELAKGKEERDRKRQNHEFDDVCKWTLADLPEVEDLIEKRMTSKKNEWAKAVNKTIREYIEKEEKRIASWTKAAFKTGDHSESASEPTPLTILVPEGKRFVRATTDHGKPSPLPGETWVEYENGTRAYFVDRRQPGDKRESGEIEDFYRHPSGLGDTDPARHITPLVGSSETEKRLTRMIAEDHLTQTGTRKNPRTPSHKPV